MPPPRQHRVLPPPALAKARAVPPLNEGFAVPLTVGSSGGRAPISEEFTPRDLVSSSGSDAAPQASSGWQPPRNDGQEVLSYSRGCKRTALAIAVDPTKRAEATEEFKSRVYSRTTQGPRDQKLATWEEVAVAAGHADPYALNSDTLYEVSAILWKAGYRSLDSYLSMVRQELLQKHGSLPEVFALHFKCISRAAARGRGPAKQAGTLPVNRLAELEESQQPFSPQGPCFPLRAVIVGIWWLLREIELANLTIECVRCEGQAAHIRLPSSKTDSEGAGATRTLGCICASGSARICPYHVVQRQHQWASEQAAALHKHAKGFPLFPTSSGHAAAKSDVIKAINGVAAQLQLPLTSVTGTPIYTGHTLRVSGAVHLAMSGIDVWRIQLHGRWGSSAVLRYVQLSPLAPSLSLEASLGRDLRQMQTAILAAKAKLVSLSADTVHVPHDESLQEVFEDALGLSFDDQDGPLGKPLVEDVICRRTKGWHRQPSCGELLVVNDATDKVHSLRPPRFVTPGICLTEEWDGIMLVSSRPTWCKCALPSRSLTTLVVCSPELLQSKTLCKRCFGKPDDQDETSGSSSASE